MKPEMERLLQLYDELLQADLATAAHLKPLLILKSTNCTGIIKACPKNN